MSKATLKSRILSELVAPLAGKWIGLPNDHRLGALGLTDYWDIVAEGIANAIVDEIETNARCDGLDSNGDSHSSVQVKIS